MLPNSITEKHKLLWGVIAKTLSYHASTHSTSLYFPYSAKAEFKQFFTCSFLNVNKQFAQINNLYLQVNKCASAKENSDRCPTRAGWMPSLGISILAVIAEPFYQDMLQPIMEIKVYMFYYLLIKVLLE